MGRLVDTSIFIESERGRLDLEPHFAAHGRAGLFISAITVSELLHGVHLARPDYRASRSAAIGAWISRFGVLKINVSIARRHSRIYAELRTAGMLIGPHDLWLAATCVTYRLTMVTANVREFEKVPNLRIENWSDA